VEDPRAEGLAVARRLDDDERNVADLFGVDVDGGKFGRAKARAKRIEEEEGAAVAMSERDWEKYERDYGKNRVASAAKATKDRLAAASRLGDGRGGISPKTGKVIAVVGTVAAAVGLVWVASKLFGSSSASAAEPTVTNGGQGSGAAPPPPPPSKATAHAGASLAVRTPQKTGAVFRSAAGKASPKATPPLLAEGAVVTVLDSATANSARWYKVRTGGGVEGWVHGDLLVAAPGGSAS
jgi:hypothetical protein